jgi:hypothetical protein
LQFDGLTHNGFNSGNALLCTALPELPVAHGSRLTIGLEKFGLLTALAKGNWLEHPNFEQED